VSGAHTRVGVLASGAGTNLDALLRAGAEPGFPAKVVLVLSNRSDARALSIAARHGVPAAALPLSQFDGDTVARDRELLRRLHAADVELVVCAGYNRILSEDVLQAYPDAILNVHPSLLPAFAGGMNAVEAALQHGVKVTGCTVQLLEPGETDGGPIVLQEAVAVRDDDTTETLLARVHEAEWRLLPAAVRLWSERRILRHGRRIRLLSAARGAGGGGFSEPRPREPVSTLPRPRGQSQR
jgi:phosphoribosylglycinamide formyltransferase 1